jgi:ribosome-binding ATPase YchF (GTP1/OBG family)
VKICVFGIPGVPLGKHNLKDPRLDQADKLAEAKKKTCAQVDVVGEDASLEADVIVVHRERFPDLILHDLEFVETRLGRNPPDAERTVLLKIQAELEAERTMYKAGLSKEELQAVAAHSFHTHKPVIVADNGELAAPDALMLRAFKEGGFICYLTVGGKENRAWPVSNGATAWEAAGVIHTDILKGFIRAEIISFEDFVQAGGETQAKRAGKQRLETKTYVMQDYDVTSFRFNK